jgi:hypothetical protein
MSEPLLIVAAFWSDTDCVAGVSKALQRFKTADEYKGAAVSFTRAVADDPRFRRTMRELQLEEANVRPAGRVPLKEPK